MAAPDVLHAVVEIELAGNSGAADCLMTFPISALNEGKVTLAAHPAVVLPEPHMPCMHPAG